MVLADLFRLLGLLSGLMFVASLLFVPWLICRLPKTYFIRHWQQVEQRHHRHPALAVFLLVMRNLTGTILLLTGLAMLVLPGQGILTILIALSLMDFPGKHRLQERFVQVQQVRKSLNWIRRKGGKTEFIFRDNACTG